MHGPESYPLARRAAMGEGGGERIGAAEQALQVRGRPSRESSDINTFPGSFRKIDPPRSAHHPAPAAEIVGGA